MSDLEGTQLNLLLFSVEGVHFGIDAEQAERTAAYDGEVADDLFWFHEEMGYSDASVTYCSPVVVTIGTDGARTYRVIIDSMEDIVEIDQEEIHLFPPLMEPFALRKGMWGIVVKDDRMILLVDFKRLLRERRATDAHIEVTSNDDI